jgi:ferric-dicitrate binding protein FerR (iron transport regulator)
LSLDAHALTQLRLDGRLPEVQRTACDAHVKACAQCQALIRSWEAFSSAYKDETRPLLSTPSPQAVQALIRKGRALPEQARPKVALWALGAAAAAAVVVLATWLTQRPAELTAVVVAASGAEVPLTGDVFEPTAREGARLHLGQDTVGVSSQSRLRLLRHDARHVRLALEKGTVACAVSHRTKGQSFTVESKGVVVSVVGTRFRVTDSEAGVRVEVAEGHVRVSSGGATWDVLPGQVLGVEGEHAQLSASAATDFVELAAPGQGVEAKPAPAPTADASAAEPEAEVKAHAQPAQDVERWRRAAAGGHCAAVLPDVRRAVREHPREAEAWRVLADCQRLAGDYRPAASAYEHVVALAPPEEADRARMLLAELLHEHLGNDAEAERVLKVYLHHPRPAPLEASARVLWARSLLSRGKPAQAHAELERVTRRLPGTPAALEALDLLKQMDGR